jgi:hypothetical protein
MPKLARLIRTRNKMLGVGWYGLIYLDSFYAAKLMLLRELAMSCNSLVGCLAHTLHRPGGQKVLFLTDFLPDRGPGPEEKLKYSPKKTAIFQWNMAAISLC